MNPPVVIQQQFVRLLAIAMANNNLYSPQHPQVIQQRNAARALHETLLGERHAVRLMVVNQQLVIDDIPQNSGLHQQRLVKAMTRCGVSHIELKRHLEDAELGSLIAWLAAGDTFGLPVSPHIRLGCVTVCYHQAGEVEPSPAVAAQQQENLRQLQQNYSADELERFAEIYSAAAKQRQLNMAGLAQIVSCFIDAMHYHADPLLALAPLRKIDDYTFVHSTNVCLLNIAQARSLGIEGAALHDIGLAALLHDVGKLFVSSEILNKPDKLDDEEWKQMQQHPQRGAIFLLKQSGVPRLSVITAFEHHLGFDQRGYPTLPAPWQQSLSSQLTAISDVFDALRTSRAYRQALEVEKIREIFRDMAGKQLHPGLTENFLTLLDEPGSDMQTPSQG